MKIQVALATVCALFVCTLAAAQEHRQSREEFRQLLQDEAKGLTSRDMGDKDMRELIDMVFMARLAAALGLNDEETVVLVRRLKEYRDGLRTVKIERSRTQRELRHALREGEDDSVIEEKLSRVFQLESAIVESTKTLVQKVGEYLNARQTAQLYLLLGDFDEDLRWMVMRARQSAQQNAGEDMNRRPRRGPGPGPGPGQGPEHGGRRGGPGGPRPDGPPPSPRP